MRVKKGTPKNNSVVALLVLMMIVRTGFGQEKQTQSFDQVWLGYFNQTRFSNKWGSWTDLHLRTKEDFFTNFFQSIVRVGLTYYLNDAAKITAGYAYVSNYPGDNHKNVTQPEHRPWQQIQWLTKYKKIKTVQGLRLEEKFRRKILNQSQLASGYNFNYKIRYNFLLQTPLLKKAFEPHGFAFIVNDDVHINFGKQVIYNYFDQNRFFVGFGYQTNKSDQLQLGYMNLFQQLATGYQYKSINGVNIFYLHNLDVRKKQITTVNLLN